MVYELVYVKSTTDYSMDISSNLRQYRLCVTCGSFVSRSCIAALLTPYMAYIQPLPCVLPAVACHYIPDIPAVWPHDKCILQCITSTCTTAHQ